MNIISTIALITINETLFIQLISFLIFLFIINRIMLRPLKSTMNERQDYMEKIRLDVDNAAKESETLIHKLQKMEKSAAKEASGIQVEIEELGNKKADEILESTLREIELIKDKNRAEVNVQITEARKHLEKESQSLAVSIMEKVLERRLAA
jgi:F-type H+-transporting ATPase subunit b